MIRNVGDDIIIITAPHFVAGVCLDKHEVAVRAAPILKYMIGWSFPRIEEYVAKKGWKWTQGTRGI